MNKEYEFILESVETIPGLALCNFWELGEHKSSAHSNVRDYYSTFKELLSISGLTEFVSEYGSKGLIVTVIERNSDPKIYDLKNIKPPKSLTFRQMYIIENELDKPNRDFEYNDLYGTELEFAEKVAEKYAREYHLKILQDLQNIAPY